MEYLLVIGFLAVLFGYAWLKKKAVIGINRAIHKKEHQQATQLLRPQVLTAPPMAPASVVDEILTELQVLDGPVVMKHRSYPARNRACCGSPSETSCSPAGPWVWWLWTWVRTGCSCAQSTSRQRRSTGWSPG